MKSQVHYGPTIRPHELATFGVEAVILLEIGVLSFQIAFFNEKQ